ncbi:mechanosensitive ion channel family protein [Vallitalea sp.]|jgi:small conductance mechanosensitive channel|uniref:mechanosensitive ion channel family protein n=1 Tax=Vallitalea sp. TaxID=1882829 RepID=UPI0025E7ED95|nr:mechanosensitive ion channel domain-containing protein [Vallitalea sp.]MCT4688040.1 mechanosensitive ion channel [Vallitalea sp.]
METVMKQLDNIKFKALEILTAYGFKILMSLVILIVGLKVIKYLVKLIEKFLNKSKVDISLSKFLLSATRLILKILLGIIIMENLAIPTTSLIAVIGATGIGVGMALQGSLANLTGGILILLLRPFKVGDFIEEKAFGHEGIVEDIQVFYTTLRTRDNKVITVPNGSLSNSSIINHSTMDIRRVDLTFGVAYEEDTFAVKRAIKEVIEKHALILKDREPYINISEHGDSSVNFAVLVWCKTKDYLQVKFDLIEQIKIKFDEENISIPYPHMDVNIVNNEGKIAK